jgi:peptidoglycan-associated lipoprotein
MSRALIAMLVAGVFLSACSSEPKKADDAAAPVAQSTAANPSAVGESDAEKMARIIKTLASKSVYFDYDSFVIKPEYQTLLKQDFDALKAVPRTALTLEGNADERGSTEYNLALGQKRADAVKRALQLLGVPETQLESISYGKEKPRATCHEEKCYAENRRVDFASKRP